MGYDLLIACVLSIIIEYVILREKYILLSPYFLFNASFLYVYILPLVMYGNNKSVNYVNRLNIDLVSNLLSKIRVFYYVFLVVSLFIFNKMRKNREYEKPKIEVISINRQTAVISVFILFVIYIVGTFIKVGFSPSVLINFLFNPRSYTYLRQGFGVINYVISIAQMLMLFVSVINYMQNRDVISFLILLFSIVFSILGGSKTSLFVVLIFLVLYNQIQKKTVINLSKLVVLVVVLIIVAFVSFYIMSGNRELNNVGDVLNFIIDYDQECYFSARVIDDFSWSPDNWLIGIRSLLLTPIPRGIFSSKELYGFYQECWRHVYQPDTVVYQSSTYGFVSEAHMLFGNLWPIICALGFNLFYKMLYKMFYKSKEMFELFILGYLYTRVYFYTRSGYLAASNVWALILFIVFGRFMLNSILRMKSGKRQTKKHTDNSWF